MKIIKKIANQIESEIRSNKEQIDIFKQLNSILYKFTYWKYKKKEKQIGEIELIDEYRMIENEILKKIAV
jgi:hypothetical protein